MNAPLIPFVVGWIVVACAVTGLAVYRKLVSTREDDRLHVRESETGCVSQQAAIAHRLDLLDRWGKSLTVVALVYGLLLAIVYSYRIWLEGGQTLVR
jgi:hypothetical protein